MAEFKIGQLSVNKNDSFLTHYEYTAVFLKKIADYIEKRELSCTEIVAIIKELANEHFTESIVLRQSKELDKK